MNLYMVSLGGKAKGCNIEVHDVQFVVADHIDNTVEALRNNWYGLPEKLHMDSHKLIKGAEGYSIRLCLEKPENKKHLFFVHLGGYKKVSTQEIHDVGLFIGEADQEVKERVNKENSVADIENHLDSLVEVEARLLSADGKTYYIDLVKSNEEYNMEPDWFGYRRIDI